MHTLYLHLPLPHKFPTVNGDDANTVASPKPIKNHLDPGSLLVTAKIATTSMKEKLCEEVRKYPVLNKSLKDFKEKNKKEMGWAAVSQATGCKDGTLVSLL